MMDTEKGREIEDWVIWACNVSLIVMCVMMFIACVADSIKGWTTLL